MCAHGSLNFNCRIREHPTRSVLTSPSTYRGQHTCVAINYHFSPPFQGGQNMTNIMNYLPELSEPERSYVQNLIDGMPTNLAEVFTIQYRRRRKDPQNVLLAAVIGLVACPGFQRFWLGETGMGCLFLFTGGLFF